jgi:predicted house-cleaning NTP pyrophosphatase (Maf/HAM1 superfamily)
MGNSKIKFILASASPRRKELVGHLKIPFEILTLNIPEESASDDPVTVFR